MNSQPTIIPNPDDYISATAIFSGIKRTIISKDFKGGRIHNLFGGTELDMSHADLNGVAILDISQAFGETRITVPQNWRVETDLTHFCSVADDFRTDVALTRQSEKILVLKGVSAFAVVEIEY